MQEDGSRHDGPTVQQRIVRLVVVVKTEVVEHPTTGLLQLHMNLIETL